MKLDLRSLAVCRISLGFLILVDSLFRLQNFTAHYTQIGIMPLELLSKHYGIIGICLHCYSTNEWIMSLLFGLQIIFAISLCLGWQTKLSTFFSWLLVISLHTRNPMIIDGGDVLLRCFLFWLMFLPTNKVWSLDSRRSGPALSSYTVKSWSFVTLPMQMFMLYFSSAALKTGADWWPHGTATGFALSLDAFATPLGKWLTGFPELLKFITRGVFLTELWGGFLLLMPGLFRLGGVLVFVGFHIGLAMTMDLALFPFIAIGCLAGLIPTEGWNLFARFRNEVNTYFKLSALEYNWSWIALPILAIVMGWNLTNSTHKYYPPLMRSTAIFLHVDQNWGMFAPYPLKDSGWYEFGLKLWDGTYTYTFVDPRMEANWDDEAQEPKNVRKYFVDQRWRKYLLNMWEHNNAKFRVGLASYLCHQWNKDLERPSERAIGANIEFKLKRNTEYLVPARDISSVDLGVYDCK